MVAVADLVARTLPATIELALLAMVIASGLGSLASRRHIGAP